MCPKMVVHPVVVVVEPLKVAMVVVGINVLVLLVKVVVHGWMPALGWKPVQGAAVRVCRLAVSEVGVLPLDFGLLRLGKVSFGAWPEAPAFSRNPAAT